MHVPFIDMMEEASRGRYAVGYFESWDMYSLEAVVEGAEELGAPAIIGFGESMTEPAWYEAGGIERCAALGKTAVMQSTAPLCLIFNEVDSYTHAVRGANAGFDVVMLDSVALPRTELRRLTAKLVEEVHAISVAVEAEVGELPTAGSGESAGELTDPREAARFVEETGIDSLAVSIGNVHLMTRGSARVDLDRLREIHESTSAALVLHGGSGFPEDAIPEVLKCGVTKFNIGTVLKRLFYQGMLEALGVSPEEAGIHEIMGSRRCRDAMQRGKSRMRGEVTRRMRLYNPRIP